MEFVGILLLLAPLGAVAVYVNRSRLMALREAIIAARSGGSVAVFAQPEPEVADPPQEAEPERVEAERAEAVGAPEADEEAPPRRMQV